MKFFVILCILLLNYLVFPDSWAYNDPFDSQCVCVMERTHWDALSEGGKFDLINDIASCYLEDYSWVASFEITITLGEEQVFFDIVALGKEA